MGTRFVDVNQLSKAQAFDDKGVQEQRVQTQMERIKSGKASADTVKIVVSPKGKMLIEDGRHRIEAARRLGKGTKLKVKFSRGSKALDGDT